MKDADIRDRIEEIAARSAATITGPWRWFGNTENNSVYLATLDRGRLMILSMDIEREEGLQETEEPFRFLSLDEYNELRADEQLNFSWSVRITPHLQFPSKEADEDQRNQHGAMRMVSHRQLARYEVLGGKTREEAGLGPNAGRSNSPLYREDFVGLDSPEAEFLAHAREDIPFLLLQLNNKDVEIDELREIVAHDKGLVARLHRETITYARVKRDVSFFPPDTLAGLARGPQDDGCRVCDVLERLPHSGPAAELLEWHEGEDAVGHARACVIYALAEVELQRRKDAKD